MPGTPFSSVATDSDAVLRALFEQDAVGVARADPDGRLVEGNARLRSMLSCKSEEQLSTLTLADLRRPDWDTSVSMLFDAAGRPESQLVMVSWGTDARRIERQAELLSRLDARLVDARDESEVLRVALEALAGLVQSGRVLLVEWHEGQGQAVLSGCYPPQAASLGPGSHPLEHLGGAKWWREHGLGVAAVAEILPGQEPPTRLFGQAVRSYALTVLERKGGWRTVLVVTDRSARVWRRDELSLLTSLLSRVWPLVEKARAERSLSVELRDLQALLLRRHGESPDMAGDDLVTRITAESERRRRLYETTLSNTPDLIYVFDLRHRFTYANSAWLETWGRTWSEVIGKTCAEVGYPDWQAATHDGEIEQVVSTKQSVRGEAPFRGADGERIHDYIFVPVLGADGEVEAIAGTTRDVTALKQAEFLMAGQAQALELMAKGAALPDVLEALCDVIDQQATERLCASIMLMQDDGRHMRPVAGRHMPASWTRASDPWLVGPENGACGSAAFRRERVLSSDIASDPLWPSDLKKRALEHGLRACWSTPIVSSGGAVLGTVALYYPRAHHPEPCELRLVEIITRTAGIAIERSRGEEGLRSHSERLRLLWEAAAILLTTEDPEALIRALFSRIAPNLGLDIFLNHMLDESARELELFSFAGVSPELAGEVARLRLDSPLLGDVARNHEPFAVSLGQRSQRTGRGPLKVLGLRAYACVPLVAGERLLGTLAFGSRQRTHFEADEVEFLRTVTRYLTVAYERLRLVRELRDADRKKDDFIALLAHELRNPLAPLRNGLAVMRLSSADSATVARARTIMERQLSHMVRLIDDLLDVSRISLNKIQLRRSQVTLADVIASALETSRPVIEAAEHRLEVNLPTEPIVLDADLTRLAQVFGNLLTNAAKYTPKRGRVAISASVERDFVTVVVEDDGIGLRPEFLRSIFGMFSQVDRSVERASGGLGIGLALVRGLTEMHGGTVLAHSEGPNCGSRFTVRLPVVVGSVTAALEEQRSTSVRMRRRFLIADDNRDAAESLATMLRHFGNEVHLAGDGIEAVERAEVLKPDVLLMDIGMPHLNGYDATRSIRSHPWGREMVIIAITGWGQESDRNESKVAGCDAHLVKPVDYGQLEDRIAEICSARPRNAERTGAETAGAYSPSGQLGTKVLERQIQAVDPTRART